MSKELSPVGEVRLSHPDHVDGGLVELHEDTIVDLTQTEDLENLAGLGGDSVDTTDADEEGELVLGGDVEVSVGLSLTLEADLLPLELAVLLDVLLGALVYVLALLPELLLGRRSLGSLDGALLSDGLPLLQDSLGNGGLAANLSN